MIRPKDRVARLSRQTDIGSGRNARFLLDKNERTEPFCNSIHEELLASINSSDLNKYPDQSTLYRILSEFLDIKIPHLLLVSGADSGLKLFYETFLEPGDELVAINPTYAMIPVYAEMFGVRLVTVGYNEVLNLDIDLLVESITSTTRIVILPNPNQPTGTLISPNDLDRIIKRVILTDTLLILDEAYHDFSDAKSSIDIAHESEHVCVLRTFSKAWGLAGVRLGYIVGHPQILTQLRKLKSLLDINVLAIKAATFLIEHYEVVDRYVKEIKKSRSFVEAELSTHAIEYFTSSANFIHIKMPAHVNIEQVSTELAQHEFLVRTAGGTATVLDGCIRITIGTREQMALFIEHLLSILSKDSCQL